MVTQRLDAEVANLRTSANTRHDNFSGRLEKLETRLGSKGKHEDPAISKLVTQLNSIQNSVQQVETGMHDIRSEVKVCSSTRSMQGCIPPWVRQPPPWPHDMFQAPKEKANLPQPEGVSTRAADDTTAQQQHQHQQCKERAEVENGISINGDTTDDSRDCTGHQDECEPSKNHTSAMDTLSVESCDILEGYTRVSYPKRQRSVVFYVGNLRMKQDGPDSTRAAVINFLVRKSVSVKSCFIISKDEEKMAVKVSVDKQDASKVAAASFWPPRVHCREWRF